jgi:hypothetical protein
MKESIIIATGGYVINKQGCLTFFNMDVKGLKKHNKSIVSF